MAQALGVAAVAVKAVVAVRVAAATAAVTDPGHG
jgi:hypothetical protein